MLVCKLAVPVFTVIGNNVINLSWGNNLSSSVNIKNNPYPFSKTKIFLKYNSRKTSTTIHWSHSLTLIVVEQCVSTFLKYISTNVSLIDNSS